MLETLPPEWTFPLRCHPELSLPFSFLESGPYFSMATGAKGLAPVLRRESPTSQQRGRLVYSESMHAGELTPPLQLKAGSLSDGSDLIG